MTSSPSGIEILPKEDARVASPDSGDFQAPRIGLQSTFDSQMHQESEESANAAQPLVSGTQVTIEASSSIRNAEDTAEEEEEIYMTTSSEVIKEGESAVVAMKGKGRKASGNVAKVSKGITAKGNKGSKAGELSTNRKKGVPGATKGMKAGGPKGVGGGKKGGGAASSSKGKDAIGSTEINGIGSGPSNSVFPLARISRIVKVDKEIEMTSKDAIWTIATATELFIKHLTDSAYAKARLDKKKIITYKELSAAVESQNEFFFLQDAIPQPISLNKALEMRRAIEAKNHLREAGLLEGDDEGDQDQETALDTIPLVNQTLDDETINTAAAAIEREGEGEGKEGEVYDRMLLVDDDDDEELSPALPNGFDRSSTQMNGYEKKGVLAA